MALKPGKKKGRAYVDLERILEINWNKRKTWVTSIFDREEGGFKCDVCGREAKIHAPRSLKRSGV